MNRMDLDLYIVAKKQTSKMYRYALYSVYSLLGISILLSGSFPENEFSINIPFILFLVLIVLTSDIPWPLSVKKVGYHQILSILERKINEDPEALEYISKK